MLPKNLKTLNDTYSVEYEKHLERLAIFKIQLESNKDLDLTKEMRIPKGYDREGNVVSWQNILRSELITSLEKEVESEQRILKIIENLFED